MNHFPLILAVAVLCACGSTNPVSQSTPTPKPTPTPLSCTTSGPASASWPAAQSISTSTPPIVSVVATGDTLTLTFVSGTPQFTVATAPSAHFTLDPSGLPLTLAGTSGVKIVLTGFRGDMSNYSGPSTIASSGPLLLEVGKIGDFEGVVSFGAGLSHAGCAHVTASGSTLTFQFIATP